MKYINQKKFKSGKYAITELFIGVLLISILCLFFINFFITGCEKIDEIKYDIVNIFNRGEESDNAVKVVEDFFNALIAEDLDLAFSYIYNPDSSAAGIDTFKEELKDCTKIIKVEINWVEVKNNIAVVGIDLIDTYDGEEKIYKDLEVSLVKDSNDKWKINFW